MARPRKSVDGAGEATGAVAPARRRSPRPLTPTQVANKLLKQIGQTKPIRSSVSLKSATGGRVDVDVTVYVGDDAKAVLAAAELARTVFDAQRAIDHARQLGAVVVDGPGE